MRVASGAAARWRTVRRVLVGRDAADDGDCRGFEVAAARSYRDRLVLKLLGVDDPHGAQALKGGTVWAPAEEVPPLRAEEYYAARLVGLRVYGVAGEAFGVVTDVVTTGGTDVLVVEQDDGHEMLVPMAKEIVVQIDEREGRIAVRLPPGLGELNRSGSRP